MWHAACYMVWSRAARQTAPPAYTGPSQNGPSTMRNLLLSPAQRATLRAYPATLPGVAAEPSADVRAELDNLRYYWRLSALETEIRTAYSIATGGR